MEMIDTFKAALFERASNHLTKSFVVAWIIHNYKFFLVIFSDESIRFKLVEIESMFASTEIFTIETNYIPGSILHGILIPLIYAIIYIFIYPHLSKPFIRRHEESLTSFRNTKSEAQKLRLISPEKYAELVILLREAESNFHQRIDALDTENRELKKLVMSKKSETSTTIPTQIGKPKITSLSKTDINVLKAHQNLEEGSGHTLKTITEALNLNIDDAKLAIDNLLKAKFITIIDLSDDYENMYTITSSGIKYIRDL